MSRYEHGRVLAVNETTLGSELVGDHAQGVGSLTVEDPVDFDEDGGWLSINGQVVSYTTYDDDTGEITLAGTLDAAASEGDRVDLWDELRQVVTVDKIAQIELDGDDDNTDPLEAIIPLHLLDDLEEGIRGLRGESVLLEQDGDEWRIVDVLGLAANGASGQRWEADDVYMLTAADVTAGVASCPLSHRPIAESVDARWGVLTQEPTEYTVDYDAKTVTWPLDGFEKAGDRLWFHYQYQVGIAAPVPILVDIPYQSTGWKYLQVANGDSVDRSAVGYDDTAWATGTAAFGSTATSGWPTPSTAWSVNSSLWVRRHLGPLTPGVIVQLRVDSSAAIYWNGSHVTDTAAVTETGEIAIPTNLIDPSDNVLAIRATDAGGDSYLDIRIQSQ